MGKSKKSLWKRISYTKLLILAFIPIFIYNLIKVAYSPNPELIFDNVASIIIVLVLLIEHHKWEFTTFSIIAGLFALSIHHLKLYGNLYFGIPFDHIMHFSAMFALTLFYFQLLYPYHESKFNLITYSIFSAIAIGSISEIIEYFGYTVIGAGEGVLGFGAGDFGEWANASWDMLCNTLGAITAAFYMWLTYHPKTKKN